MSHYVADKRMIEAYNQERKRGLDQAILEDLSVQKAEQKVNVRKSVKERALCCVGQWLASWGRNMINAGNRARVVQLKGL